MNAKRLFPALLLLGFAAAFAQAADAVPEPSRASARVAEVLADGSSDGLEVPLDAPLESLLGNEGIRRLGALAAVDAEGRIRGVITAEQVGRALRNALGSPPSPAA